MRTLAAILAIMAMIGPSRIVGFADRQASAAESLPLYGYTVVNSYPHDKEAFTQGLQ